MDNRINRRDFLKTVGAVALGSTAIVSLPSLFNLIPQVSAASPGTTGLHFLGQGKASTVSGVDHRITMSGEGKVNPSNREVKAAGSFTHFDNSGARDPKTLLSSGDWGAERLVSFNLIGTWGPFAAGIVEMDVDLAQSVPSKSVIPARLKLVSNINPAGLTTRLPQGFTLTIPDASFGPFKPLGSEKNRRAITIFTTRPGQ